MVSDVVDIGVALALTVDDQAAQANVDGAVSVVSDVAARLVVAVAATDALDSSETRAELSDGASIQDAGSSPLYVVVNAFPAESVAVNVYNATAARFVASTWAAVGAIILAPVAVSVYASGFLVLLLEGQTEDGRSVGCDGSVSSVA